MAPMRLPAMVFLMLLVAAAVLLGAAYLPTLRAKAEAKPNTQVIQACAKYRADPMMAQACEELDISH